MIPNQAKRNLQLESVAHITVQREKERKLREESKAHVTSMEFLCDLHREFYLQLPEAFHVVTHPETGRKSVVEPGELRKEAVEVGYHEPPAHDSLKAFIERFDASYSPEKHHGALKLIAVAAAHHRLMWIHPFLDGNGRVARLFAKDGPLSDRSAPVPLVLGCFSVW